jgi:single-stranded-DNA-specific exonuclease
VVISTENGMGRGSARGVPGIDLYRALKDCDEVLETYGGHPAAAGLSLETDRIPEFRSLLREAIIEQAGGVPEASPERVDACIGGRVIGLGLAEELDRLRPFGSGNPSPRYLIPSARIEGLTEMGEGRHCRFTVKSGDSRAGGVAFGRTGFGIEADEPVDLVAELSINHWNGTMTPRLEVIDAVPLPTEFELLATAGEQEWWSRFELSISGDSGMNQSISPESVGSREPVRHEGAATAVMAEQVSSGESVLILVSEAWRRWRDLRGVPGIDRFSPNGVTDVRGLWAGSPESERSPFMEVGAGSIRLTDYESLPPEPDWVSEFGNVVLFDPPPRPESLDLASAGGGLLHHVADRESLAYALGAAETRDPRPFLRPIFRAVRDGGEITGEELKRMLDSDGVAPLAPERAAALITVLLEAGITRSTGTGTGRTLGSVSSDGIDLERSVEYRRLIALQQEETLFLKRSDS